MPTPRIELAESLPSWVGLVAGRKQIIQHGRQLRRRAIPAMRKQRNTSGVELRRAIGQRAIKALINGFHPYPVRHTAAPRGLRTGGSEGGLMAVGGWAKRDMLGRYVAATTADRATDEARKLCKEHGYARSRVVSYGAVNNPGAPRHSALPGTLSGPRIGRGKRWWLEARLMGYVTLSSMSPNRGNTSDVGVSLRG